MLLGELQVGTPITLEIVAGNKKFEVPLKVMKRDTISIYTEAFRYGGKVVDFKQKGFEHLLFNVYASDANSHGRFAWKGVSAQLITSGGVPYYKLQARNSVMHGVSLNRRGEKRHELNTAGQAFSMATGMGSAVHVFDVSSQGLSFLASPGFAEVNEVVDIRFISSIFDKNFDIALAVQVVRIVPKKGGNVLYGCKVINPSRDFQTFVNIKTLYEKKLGNSDL